MDESYDRSWEKGEAEALAKQRLWLDLDKSYRQLHLVLTGEEFSLDLPGAVDSDDDQPARYNHPARVREIATVFAATTYDDLVEKDGFDYAEGSFGVFKDFYLRATEAHFGILVFFL